MKNLKTYNHEGIEYKYSLVAKKWEFFLPQVAYRFFSKSPGGAETAHKIAHILAGSVKRSKTVDGLARKLVNKLVTPKQEGLSVDIDLAVNNYNH